MPRECCPHFVTMETRRRSRILLKAALGSSAVVQDSTTTGYRLELSDDASDTIPRPAIHHSEIAASLKGVGPHYDHNAINMGWKVSRKKAISQPRLATLNEAHQNLSTRRISTSSSSPIGNHNKKGKDRISVPSHVLHLPDSSRPSTTESLLSRDSTTTADPSEMRELSSASDIDGEEVYETPKLRSLADEDSDGDDTLRNQKQNLSDSDIESGDANHSSTNSAPFLSNLTEDVTVRSLHLTEGKRSFSRPQTAPTHDQRRYKSHDNVLIASTLSSQVRKKCQSALPTSDPTLCNISADSPRFSRLHEIFRPIKSPKIKAPHSKRNGSKVHPMAIQQEPVKQESTSTTLPALLPIKRTSTSTEDSHQQHPNSTAKDGMLKQKSFRQDSVGNAHEVPEHEPPLKRLSSSTEEPFRVINTSPSTPSITSRRLSASVSDSTRSSVSSTLTPLFTSSLRMKGSRSANDTKWELGGDSQLTSCFPDRNMRIFIVTWNMQEIKVARLESTLQERVGLFFCC